MARTFNGTTDVVKKSAVSSTAVNNFAFCCWIYPSAFAATMTAFINGYDGGGSGTGWSIDTTSGSKAQVTLSFIVSITSTTSLSANTWYHVIGERSGGTTTLYLNGTADGGTTASAPNAPTQTLAIGSGQNNVGAVNRPFSGSVCETAIWERVLTATEKTQLAAGFSPAFFPQNLVHYAPVKGANSPEVDTKSSTVLTVTGTTSFAHPDFMKYPNRPNTGLKLRPAIFSPGIAR